MSVSALSSLSSLACQQGMNSSDPVQAYVSGVVLNRSQKIDKQNIQDLVQSTATSSPAPSVSPGEVGYSVNVYA